MKNLLFFIKYTLYMSGTLLTIIPLIIIILMNYYSDKGLYETLIYTYPNGLLIVGIMIVGLILLDIGSYITLDDKK